MAEGRKSSRLKRWSLKGMTALVTGGTRGIGHETVEELAEFGATIHTCSRNQNELDECLEEWKRKGYQVTGSVCDLSCRDQREKLIETVSSLFQGKLNILVNNAAKFLTKRTTEVTSEDFSMIMATNFESCYHLCQLGHPLLKASENGSIVFISSVAGGISLPYVSVYTASKGAMNQLTKTLACEWAKDNIRSNAVAPWITKTSLVESVLRESAQMKEGESALMKEGLQPFIDRTPIGRIAEVEDVSSLIAFLCLPAASYITGQVIYVDGGYIVNGYP